MSGLKRFMLLWVSFMAQHAFAAIPIVPENVLNQGEVSQITTQNNYFFAQTADDVSPIWRLTERKYGSHFLNSRHVFFSLDDVIQHVLRDGFPVQYMMQQLFRARLGVHVAVGGVIPRNNILFGEVIACVNMNQCFSGFFGI
ncbi:MAG: hypothetical protein OXT67_04905, partial [Zetaproteobacteria bacterium]|nr:hypothetical protein [Zetaproteobacteria bacterium]